MSALRLLFTPWYWLAGKIFAVWARPSVLPEDPAALLAGQVANVCYVLETGGLADTLALERICRLHGLPTPSDALD
jgi:glycerol-3-phosphate O-acyltransferase